MIEDRDLVVQYFRIDLIAVNPLLKDRLVIEVEWQTCCVEGAGTFEGSARLDLKHVIDTVAVLVQPLAD